MASPNHHVRVIELNILDILSAPQVKVDHQEPECVLFLLVLNDEVLENLMNCLSSSSSVNNPQVVVVLSVDHLYLEGLLQPHYDSPIVFLNKHSKQINKNAILHAYMRKVESWF